MGRLRDDAQAGRGASAELPAHQGARSCVLSEGRGAARRIRRTTPSSPTPTGKIAYLHPQFIPVRDDRFDYTKPVDGSDPAHRLARPSRACRKRPRVLEPGQRLDPEHQQLALFARPAPDSPRPGDFPALHGHVRRNSARAAGGAGAPAEDDAFTLEGLRDAAYDPYQTGLRRADTRACRSLGQARPNRTRSRAGCERRSRCCAPGIIAGAPIRWKRRWPCSGASACGRRRARTGRRRWSPSS